MKEKIFNNRILIISFILVFFLAGVCGIVFISHKRTGIADDIILEIPQGIGLNQIAELVESKKIVSSGRLFKWLAIFLGKGRKIKSGEYLIKGNISLFDLVLLLAEGKEIPIVITIPEGLNMHEIFNLLSKSKIDNNRNYLKYSKSSDLLKDIPFSKNILSLEGFLFPETYAFSKHTSEKVVLAKMVRTFWENLPVDYAKASKKVGLTVYQAIILASIIEKETGVAYERAIISSVFHNRLRKGIPLATDPTVIYGIKNYKGNLTKKHLGLKTPYNTYINPGLPPTPIANPGLNSIVAAVKPAKTNYLYFVATGNGAHKFSVSYREHLAAVNKFQRYGRKKNYRSY